MMRSLLRSSSDVLMSIEINLCDCVCLCFQTDDAGACLPLRETGWHFAGLYCCTPLPVLTLIRAAGARTCTQSYQAELGSRRKARPLHKIRDPLRCLVQRTAGAWRWALAGTDWRKMTGRRLLVLNMGWCHHGWCQICCRKQLRAPAFGFDRETHWQNESSELQVLFTHMQHIHPLADAQTHKLAVFVYNEHAGD